MKLVIRILFLKQAKSIRLPVSVQSSFRLRAFVIPPSSPSIHPSSIRHSVSVHPSFFLSPSFHPALAIRHTFFVHPSFFLCPSGHLSACHRPFIIPSPSICHSLSTYPSPTVHPSFILSCFPKDHRHRASIRPSNNRPSQSSSLQLSVSPSVRGSNCRSLYQVLVRAKGITEHYWPLWVHCPKEVIENLFIGGRNDLILAPV